MFASLCFSFVACLFILDHCAASSNEGDNCILKDGSRGTCRFITSCPAALQSKVLPEICGFQGTQSICCCKNEEMKKTITTTTTNAPITATTTREPEVTTSRIMVANRLPGEISKKKCKEYSQYAYERIQSPTLKITPTFSNTLECPFEKFPLIVGGTLAIEGEFPHMALIGYKPKGEILWACGGSLISENFVLTAGHCLKHHELGSAALVRVGLTNQSDLAHMQERTVSEIIACPEYRYTKYHDIGLLRLSKYVELNIYSRPACLQTQKDFPYENVTASGWEKIRDSGEGSKDLLKVVLEFFSLDKCNHTYRNNIITRDSTLKDGIIDDLMICAGSSIESRDTCKKRFGSVCVKMLLQKPVVIVLFTIIYSSFTRSVVQGATPGERSKEMCKKYLQYVPNSYDCAFLKKSLAIGNEFAKEEEFPHMVMLGFESENKTFWACSATLISEQYVLAAAHCLIPRNFGRPSVVRLGVANLTDTVHRQDIKVAEVIPHPDYKNPLVYNDIGLVKLEKKVDINVYTRPACLYTEKEIGTKEAVNSGWGATEFNGEFNNGLQKVVLELYDLEGCNRTYHKLNNRLTKGIDYDTMVCAGTKSLVTYQPDSGGPLTIIHREDRNLTCIYDVVGVASFGDIITPADVPSVYTRVSAYIKWIEDTVWK
ncbi:serine protease persephone [Anoplophora glabripennis]|uniref:serine protease persephone n=1 Tax=Anoplophora glabripennis TaxID=217634 RepID=UPI00087529EB|nr:serine protease persephone [Anoplophora glabripennis]